MNIKRNIPVIAAAVVLSTAVSGCGIYKKYETPQNTVMTAAYVAARDSMAADSTAFANLLWEQVYTDPVLADMITRALANNSPLNDALTNVGIAQAQLKGAKLAFLPSVALAPNGAGSGTSYEGSSISWSYQLPVQVSWEADIFGKLLSSKRGAKVAVERSEAYAQAVRSQVIASVANTYYAMSAVDAQLAISRHTARLWEQTVATMRSLKDAGKTTEAAVVQSDASYRSVLASITDLEVQRTKLDNTMSLLLNVMPQHWYVAADASLSMPQTITVAGGVPVSLLAMRPDVTSAERGLAAAYYTTQSARAAFYPDLTISFAGGFTNNLGSMIKNPGEWFYNIGAQLVAPLFSRGQNIARLEAAKLSQNLAMSDFETAILTGAGEVSNALVIYDKAGERAQHLREQVKDLERSVSITNDLMVYANGTYLEVITAQQSLLQAQLAEISCSLTRSQAVVSAYQAMGGGR